MPYLSMSYYVKYNTKAFLFVFFELIVLFKHICLLDGHKGFLQYLNIDIRNIFMQLDSCLLIHSQMHLQSQIQRKTKHSRVHLNFVAT